MKNKTILNIFLSWTYQVVVIVSGIIVPKLILSAFGSEVNGLVTSATQFLNYIYIIEGGLGGVVLVNLYKPLAENNEEKISRVVSASNSFFRIIGIIFGIYALGLSIVYPLIVKSSFDYWYIFSLILILSINLLTQYCFSISFRLLLQADQKIYVVHIINIITAILNIGFAILVVNVKSLSNIHILKASSALLFIAQPVVYHIYVKKHYSLKPVKVNRKEELPNRWSCFGHNIAFFINSNTDVTFLTLIKGLAWVSVYSVHVMVTGGLKNVINAFSQVFGPKIGTAIAVGDEQQIKKEIDNYEFFSYFITTIIFGCCICLITPFIKLYTEDVTDIDYFQPIFAILITSADFLFCIRLPYEAVAYGTKNFKNMSIASFIEAGINITVSLALIWQFGIIGIAIGTCSAMTFRIVWYLVFLKRTIPSRSILKSIKRLVSSIAVIIASYLIFTLCVKVNINNYWSWCLVGLASFGCILVLTITVEILVDFKAFKTAAVSIVNRLKRRPN